MQRTPLTEIDNQEHELKALVSDILTEAEKQGATAAEVAVSDDRGFSVVVRQRELETVEFNRDRGFGITVYRGNRKGTASTSDSSADAIRSTVRAAINIARFTQEDTCNGLADPARMAVDFPDLDLYHPWDVGPDELREIAFETETASLDYDPRIVNSEGAQASTQCSMRVYGNSHGFIAGTAATRHNSTCVVIAQDDGGMQRDHWYTISRDAEDLEAPVAVGEESARRALARLGPRPVATGTYPVLFNAQLAAGLIGHLVGAISGGSLFRRASYLVDSLGKSVIASGISLTEHPHLSKALGSANFDTEGVATSEKAFVANGTLESYILGSYSARRLGLESTGNSGGVFNLSVDSDTTTPEALMESMGTGLVVTDLMGQGVNLVSGDYSRGAAGIWVENGKPVYPVEEVTIASNLNDMLLGIIGFGDDLDYRGNIRTGSLLVNAMTVAA
jgi:PmbA protein